jgi:hypothetical protein
MCKEGGEGKDGKGDEEECSYLLLYHNEIRRLISNVRLNPNSCRTLSGVDQSSSPLCSYYALACLLTLITDHT